ncbi:MAG: ComF family protein [Verrucomicrobiota bacterium]
MIWEALKRPLEAGLGFFYPQVCQLCGLTRATAAEGYVCAGCRAGARPVQPPWCECCGRPYPGAITAAFVCGVCQEEKRYFVSARSAVVFEGPVREALHRYKYQRALWFEPFFAGLLQAGIPAGFDPGAWDCLAPVPLHRVKLAEREFNQAERLGRELCRLTGIRMNTRLLRRLHHTRTQTQLTREERTANVRNAFGLKRGVRLTGERVLLFDDVMTTGATTNECARILLQGGASTVGVWTLARGT